ncbi:hypothetical protein TKK_0012656 [Trichogramma kaykai]
MVAMFSNVVNHAKGTKHCQKLGILSPMDQDFKIPYDEEKEKKKRTVADMKIRLIAAIVHLNIPFKKTTRFINLLKSFSKQDYETIQNVKMGYTQAQAIAEKSIGRANQERIAEKLNRPFSILVDESTDVSDKKILSISVRYTDLEDKVIKNFIMGHGTGF